MGGGLVWENHNCRLRLPAPPDSVRGGVRGERYRDIGAVRDRDRDSLEGLPVAKPLGWNGFVEGS